MQLKQLFNDEGAVSPVIGVILMVAITVILAAVIGTFVLGLGDQVQETSPTAQWDWDASGDLTEDSGELIVSHEGGDPITPSNLEATGAGTNANTCNDDGQWSSSQVTAGNSCTITESGSTPQLTSGETVRLVWTSDSGEQSSTLSRYNVQ